MNRVDAMSGLISHRLSKTVTHAPVRGTVRGIPVLFNQGKISHTPHDVPMVVGLGTGGYFRSELNLVNMEIEQFQKAIEIARGLTGGSDPSTWKLKPITQEENDWFNASWIPFYQKWVQFYKRHITGWRSYTWVVRTSLLENLEDYRKVFIQLRAKAEDIIKDPVITNLPAPTPPKKYTSFMDDIGDLLWGVLKWTLVLAGGILLLLYVRGAQF